MSSSPYYTVTDLFMSDSSVCVLHTKPCLASQSPCSPTVFLDVHLSLSGLSTLGPACQLVDICLLPPLPVVMAANPPYTTTTNPPPPPDPSPPLAGQPSPPLSRVSPQTPAVNHLCLSCSPPRLVMSTASTALFLKLSLYFYACVLVC